MKTKDEDELKALVERGIKIPPQPKILLELHRRLLDDDYDLRVLARIIGQDPGLVAMLFRAARSPVFARHKTLESVEQVLQVLGVKQTFSLVQAVALSTALSDSSRTAFERFWTRSQEIAQLAAIIAGNRVSVCNVFPEQAYMAGIFHECGVPVLMQRFPEYCQALNLGCATCWPDLAEEDARFNVDHCTIGYLVARHWNLPDFVCAAIQYHHELPTDEAGAARTLVAILQLAVHFYHRLSHSDDRLWPKIRLPVLAELGLHPEDEQEYFDEISERFLARA